MEYTADQLRNKVRELWDDQGSCGSCGWHACMYEHDIEDYELLGAIKGDGVLELGCARKDGEGGDHRGVKIYLREALVPIDKPKAR